MESPLHTHTHTATYICVIYIHIFITTSYIFLSRRFTDISWTYVDMKNNSSDCWNLPHVRILHHYLSKFQKWFQHMWAESWTPFWAYVEPRWSLFDTMIGGEWSINEWWYWWGPRHKEMIQNSNKCWNFQHMSSWPISTHVFIFKFIPKIKGNHIMIDWQLTHLNFDTCFIFLWLIFGSYY